MPEVHRSALVPYSPMQMFELVRDVARYPEFLNWVRRTELHEQSDEHQLATLEVQLGGLVKRFTTCNRLVPGSRLSMRLHEGPFDELSGQWRFEPYGGGSRVELELVFRLPGSLMFRPFQSNFGRMADRMVDDFRRRAEQVYGHGHD